MMKTLTGLGVAIALLSSGCTPANNETTTSPQATPTTVSYRVVDQEVASIDLVETDSLDHEERMASRHTDSQVNPDAPHVRLARKALEGNLAEQQLASLAVDRAENPKVKEAAMMIASDHKKAENQLREVAGESLPDVEELTFHHYELKTSLEKLSGHDFDKAFIKAMVSEHERDLEFYEQQGRVAPSEPLRSYFAQNARVIKKHLDHCKKLQDEIG